MSKAIANPDEESAGDALSESEALGCLEAVRTGGGNRFLKGGVSRELARRAVSFAVRTWMDMSLLTGGFTLDDPHRCLSRFSMGMIGVCWHHRLLGMLLAFREVYGRGWTDSRSFAMISASEDGELIARIYRDYGGSCVRGSASRGATDALRAAINELAVGGQVYLTPDGPRGPSRSIKDGALELARISGKPMVPVSANFGRCLRFEGTWDGFEMPLFFGRVSFHVGMPVWVVGGEDRELTRERLRKGMEEVTARADAARRLQAVRLGKAKVRKKAPIG